MSTLHQQSGGAATADQSQRHSEDKSGEAITDTKSLAAALQRVRGVALADGKSSEQLKA